MSRLYIGLGSNSGDREGMMTSALHALAAEPGIDVQDYSSLYETPPWGKTNQPDFLNAVVAVRTAFPGEAVLQRCLAVERELGRVRREKWGMRTIDLDLLYGEDEECHTPFLELPHPYLKERAFVLVPLLQVAGDIRIDGERISSLLENLPEQNVIKEIKKPVRGKLIWKRF
ncbi:2-amino-4-hydroxy-6-hydroxymethyldihydropteridine diphosphokinase [Colibacter massiliensis]|uniref:2-amino-4-hydroxy-6- hydroxymethyldihydropteridine diphosphokinase n=1 Tax=Colibacter massiliensis TaxID=1852379 RepID=UPI00266D8C98|nr:2-amino-4-hydroxy-6-hydroxymethyldihydropteridine diphosphokinase [Colibacter massiliensis]